MERGEKTAKKGLEPWGKEVLRLVLYFAVVFLAAFLLQRFVVQQVEVSGSSMEHTLQDGNRMFLEKITYQAEGPKRFDIIVFHPYEDEEDVYYIKRVIGLPGETLQIKDGAVYINGEEIEESYGTEEMEDAGIAADQLKLGESEYFVLGDNRNQSKDSRVEEVGLVKKESIVGRVFLRVWPIQKIGLIDYQ